jgi:hypothetical protein
MNRGLDGLAAIRIGIAIVVGWATSWVVLNAGFALLRASWSDYASADPDKSYTLAMLFVRLAIFSTMIAATSATATIVSADKRSPWVTGGIILALSVPPHLYPGYVWNDYPGWYHIGYLLSVLPIAVLAGQLVQRLAPRAFVKAPAT